jgi:hypothetical protein
MKTILYSKNWYVTSDAIYWEKCYTNPFGCGNSNASTPCASAVDVWHLKEWWISGSENYSQCPCLMQGKITESEWHVTERVCTKLLLKLSENKSNLLISSSIAYRVSGSKKLLHNIQQPGVIKRAHNWTVSWAICIQSIFSYSNVMRSVLILQIRAGKRRSSSLESYSRMTRFEFIYTD